MQYKFLKRYRHNQTNYKPGDVVDLTDEQARHINRDEPGTVVLAEVPTLRAEPQAEARTLETPPQDRAVRAAAKKRGKAK